MSEAIREQFADGERKYRRMMHFLKAGDHVVNHQHHHFDHLMRVERGGLNVGLGGFWYELRAGYTLMVPARTEHEALALVDDTLAWCEFELRDGVPDSEAWF